VFKLETLKYERERERERERASERNTIHQLHSTQVLIQSAQLLQMQYWQLLTQEGKEPWLHGSHSQIERSCHIPNSGIPAPQIACTRMLLLGHCSELDIGFGHVNKWPLIVGLPDTSHKTICRPVPFVNRPSWSSHIVQLCFSFSCHVKYVLLLRT